jgi:drug/metabolite transporter (DMT)-like permease
LSRQSSFKAVDVLLILVAITWGLNTTVVKISLQLGFTTLAFNSMRFILASVTSLILLFLVQRKITFHRKDIFGLFLMGLLGHTIYQFLFIEGTHITTAGNTAILLATAPIHVAWISILLRIERARWFITTGLILSFSGILLVFGSQSGLQFFTSDQFWGDILVLLAGFLLGLYTSLSKKWLSTYTPLEFSTYTMILGTIPMLILSGPAMIEQDWAAISMVAWAGMIFSAVISIAACYFVWNWGLQVIGSTRTAMYNNLPPAFAMISGVILLQEQITFYQVAGALLIVIGVLVARFGSQWGVKKDAASTQS